MIVPAYSKDGVSAGYLLAETYGVFSDDLITAHNGLCVARFVAEEETGTYVSLVRQSRADVLLYYSHQLRKSTFYCFAFPKDTLYSLVNSGVNDIKVYETAIQDVFCADNLKQCSRCGQLAGEPCDCVFTFMRTKSPLDLSAIKHNIVQTHLGQALGKGLYEILENGISKVIIPVDAQHQIHRVPKSGTSKRLLNWAIGHALGDVPVQISHSIGSSFTSALSVNSTLDPVVSQSEEEFVSHSPSETHVSIIKPAHETTQISCLDLSTVSTAPTSSTNPCTSTAPPPLSITDPGWPWNTTFQPNAVIVSELASSGSPTDIGDGVQSFPPSVPETAHAQPANSIPVNTTSVAPRTANRTSNFRPIRIAPRASKIHTTSRLDEADFDNDKMKKSAEEVRAWRLYQRRIRNRESAARSNRARKQREMARRKELARVAR